MSISTTVRGSPGGYDERGDGEVEYQIVKPSLYVSTKAHLTRDASIADFSALTAQPVRVLGLIEKDDDDIRAEIVPPFRRAGAELRITTGFSPKTLAARLAPGGASRTSAPSSCSRSPTPTRRASRWPS